MRRLLWVIGCAAAKHPGPLPALEKYQGRQFSLVASYLPKILLHGDDVAILSAGYGLVRHDQVLDDYDIKMTPAIAAAFRHDVPPLLHAGFNMVFVHGGLLYRQVLDAWSGRVPVVTCPLVGRGRGCGDHYSALKAALTSVYDEVFEEVTA